jgi:hypothetical protein
MTYRYARQGSIMYEELIKILESTAENARITAGRLRTYQGLTQTDRHHRRRHASRVRVVAGLVNRCLGTYDHTQGLLLPAMVLLTEQMSQ